MFAMDQTANFGNCSYKTSGRAAVLLSTYARVKVGVLRCGLMEGDVDALEPLEYGCEEAVDE